MNTSEQIFDIIVNTIEEKKLLKQDCINACGLSSTFFSDWKAGRFKSPSYDKLIKIALFLKIDLYYLFLGEQEFKPYFLDEHEVTLVEQYRQLSDFDKGAFINELMHKTSTGLSGTNLKKEA